MAYNTAAIKLIGAVTKEILGDRSGSEPTYPIYTHAELKFTMNEYMYYT